MNNFDYRDNLERDFFERFPNWVRGYGIWRDFAGILSFDFFNYLRNFGIEEKKSKPLPCPRVFISHRQKDTGLAERIAWLANQNGFYYWLDVHEENLNRIQQGNFTKNQKELLIGAIIEMAIMNCTHVLAVMTPNTPGSMWVPYEYGRIVDLPTNSLRASSWIESTLRYQPEYLQFGVKHFDENSINNWYRAERKLFAGNCKPDWGNKPEPNPLP